MKYLPQHPDLKRHVDHFWIVGKEERLFDAAPPLLDFPGLSPELIIVLDGYYTIQYQGRWERVDQATLYSFLYTNVLIDCSNLHAFAIVRFKPRNLSSLLPFLPHPAEAIMRKSVCKVADVFDASTLSLLEHLPQLSAPAIASELESWLLPQYRREREGFLAEMAAELPNGGTPKELMATTRYSYATLERHFRRETGLTPKRYQTIHRFRQAINAIYGTASTDWLSYVERYGYYDQSHFIREVKRYSGLTPSAILQQPGLWEYRHA